MSFYKIDVLDYLAQPEPKVIKSIIISRVKRKDLKVFIQLTGTILEDFMFYNASVGSFLSNEPSYKLLQQVSKLIPTTSGEPLPLEDIEDDYDLLVRLFVSEAWNGKEFENLSEGFKPSILAKLNQIDYSSQVGKALVVATQKREVAHPEIQTLLEAEK
jgi:hypothetical protein